MMVTQLANEKEIKQYWSGYTDIFLRNITSYGYKSMRSVIYSLNAHNVESLQGGRIHLSVWIAA